MEQSSVRLSDSACSLVRCQRMETTRGKNKTNGSPTSRLERITSYFIQHLAYVLLYTVRCTNGIFVIILGSPPIVCMISMAHNQSRVTTLTRGRLPIVPETSHQVLLSQSETNLLILCAVLLRMSATVCVRAATSNRQYILVQKNNNSITAWYDSNSPDCADLAPYSRYY